MTALQRLRDDRHRAAAARPLSAARWSSATAAATGATATAPAATATAPSARASAASRLARQAPRRTARLRVPPRRLHAARPRSPLSPCRTSAGPLQPALPHRGPHPARDRRRSQANSAPRSASSPSSTPGAATSPSTPTCTASSRAAASLPRATAGSPAGPRFFLPVRVLSRRFRTLFLKQLETGLPPGQPAPRRLPRRRWPRPAAFDTLPRSPCARREWVVYSKPPFDGPAPRPRLPGPLHPPRRHLQRPPPGHRGRRASASAGRTTASRTAARR